MKGVILAGGTGSRLYPLTKVINKHLLPVYKYPMIYYPIYKLIECGIRDILIVTGVEHLGGIVKLLSSGKEFNASFTYRVQEDAGGIAQALSLAVDFVQGDKMVVILGDNLFEDSIKPFVNLFENQESGAKVLLKESDSPERFGVAEISGDKILSIEEKPTKPKSSLCVTGVYMYDNKVFEHIDKLVPSARGELEITDVNNIYIREDILTFNKFNGWWTDAGTIESLLLANNLLAQKERG